MCIWPFRRVDSVVFVFCIKFGSNICYSHWDRRTYALDLRSMTSRELTSGFDFWSRGHLCMAVMMHFPMKFGACTFIQSGVIDIFPKLKMVAAAILYLFGWAMGPPTKPHSWCVPAVKNCHDPLFSFQVIRIWISFSFWLESPIHAPQISVFGGFYPQSLGVHRSDPQKALPWAERRVLSPHWSRSDAQCDLWLWQWNQKKTEKRQWQTGYLPKPPTSPYRSQSLRAGWSPVCSSIFQVLLKSVQWFCRCGWSKIALSHYFGHWLIQQLVLPYVPW